MSDVNYEARSAALRRLADADGVTVQQMLQDDMAYLPDTYNPDAPLRYLVAVYSNDREEYTFCETLPEAFGHVHEEVLHGRETGPIYDLDSEGASVTYDVRVDVALPNQTALDWLRAMHRYLFPERYEGSDYEEGDCYQWHAGTIEDVASMLNRALAWDDSTQMDADEKKEARAMCERIEAGRGQ